jgi:hypothetical protein
MILGGTFIGGNPETLPLTGIATLLPLLTGDSNLGFGGITTLLGLSLAVAAAAAGTSTGSARGGALSLFLLASGGISKSSGVSASSILIGLELLLAASPSSGVGNFGVSKITWNQQSCSKNNEQQAWILRIWSTGCMSTAPTIRSMSLRCSKAAGAA